MVICEVFEGIKNALRRYCGSFADRYTHIYRKAV